MTLSTVMKYALIDYTNFGVVFVSDSPFRWTMTILRSCIVDTNIVKIMPSNPVYGSITNASIRDNFYYLDRAKGITLGDLKEANEIYYEKQHLARLMHPLIALLVDALSTRSLASLSEHGIPMDDTIALEVLQSKPESGEYSPGVLEYANTLDITPEQAYTELMLEYKTFHAVKMRTYAMSRKYQSLIRQVKTIDDANALRTEIQQKLINDTYI